MGAGGEVMTARTLTGSRPAIRAASATVSVGESRASMSLRSVMCSIPNGTGDVSVMFSKNCARKGGG